MPIPLSFPEVNCPTWLEVLIPDEFGFSTLEKAEELFQLLKTMSAFTVSKSTCRVSCPYTIPVNKKNRIKKKFLFIFFGCKPELLTTGGFFILCNAKIKQKHLFRGNNYL